MTIEKTQIHRGLWRFALIALSLMVSAPAFAQQQPQAPTDQSHVRGTHGDWTIRCTGPEPGAGATTGQSSESDDGRGNLESADSSGQQPAANAQPPQCVMVQIARHSEQENIGLSIIVVRQAVEGRVVSQMRITTPITVFLPAGVGFEVDGVAVARLPYEVCSPQGVCVATVFVDEELEAKLKRGATVNLYLKDVRGQDGVFGLSLSGFTAAFESLVN